jgi:hypothetical protein
LRSFGAHGRRRLTHPTALICPTGCRGDLPVQPLLQKDFRFHWTQIKSRTPPFRPRERGVSRSSRTLGTECGGRGSVRRAGQTARGRMALFPSSLKLRRTGKKPVEAFGADGSSGRRSRVVLTPRRWCQVRGNIRATTVARKPGHRGEHEVSR